MKHAPLLLLLFAIGLYIGFFTHLTFLRHDNLYSRRLDLGNMDQTVWNVANGHGFTLTDPMGVGQQSRLAVHADFLLVLLAPLYWIWSSPKMLLAIQTVILGMGAIPVFLLAADMLGSPLFGLLFGIGYLLYPPLQRSNIYDFHAVVLSTSFLLWAYWNMHKKRYVWFIVCAVLAALGKEQVWLTVGLMGLYIAFIHKKRMLGGVITIAGFFMFYLLLWHLIPAVTVAKQHFALAYLSEFGGDQTAIVKNLLLHPLKALGLILLPDRLAYLFRLFAPTGFLSLFAPLTMFFAAPSLLINLLSNNALMRVGDFQYDSTITPFVIVGAIVGLAWFMRMIRRILHQKGLSVYTALPIVWYGLALLFGMYMWGEIPHMKRARDWIFATGQWERDAVLAVAKTIPTSASVSVTNNIGAHFSQRQYYWNYPVQALAADYVFVNMGDPNSWPSVGEQEAMLKQLLVSEQYTLMKQYGTFYAFQRK